MILRAANAGNTCRSALHSCCSDTAGNASRGVIGATLLSCVSEDGKAELSGLCMLPSCKRAAATRWPREVQSRDAASDLCSEGR